MQLVHVVPVVAPTAGEKVPAAQGVHIPAPAKAEKVPAAIERAEGRAVVKCGSVNNFKNKSQT